jgi:hypothetical protein
VAEGSRSTGDTPEAAERARLAAVLRRVAAGRAEYATNAPDGAARWLAHEASLFEVAARIVEGDGRPLFGLLPSWRWDDEVNARGSGQSGVPR